MKWQNITALVVVELKKLYRDPMNLAVMILMPVGLTLIYYLALSGIYNDYYPVPGMNHFEYLLPGVMGYAVIYMGMMVALALVEYRKEGVLKRIAATPVSPVAYLGSHIIANMIIATFQALIVLLVAWLLGYEPLGGIPGVLLASLFLALLGITAVGLGLITAAIAKESGAASGLAVIYIVPMMMFGSFLAVFNETTRTIARFMPNYYVTDSLQVIFHTGRLTDPVIGQNLLILSLIALGMVVIGIQAFQRRAY
ncbi:MAG: ABC transporter permease [Anaerolineales bacterium]|nr:ABC transporter permease [Anaerolineales bacterium]MCB8963216.1 ABC transporter permease [Ardenticatenales bacterium]MCB0006664.1 ABC transporter permease [Anaerolineales bacterium]MCB0011012.1 ABC transporter permease [Anaerolineales bacterium]MCB0020123.1 ABC transporter permease [Anaerolineales bacterium]